MTAQTHKAERPDEAAARGSGSDSAGDRGDPRYRFAAPVSVSREDIAERIAEHVGRVVVKPKRSRYDRWHAVDAAFGESLRWTFTDGQWDAATVVGTLYVTARNPRTSETVVLAYGPTDA